MEELHLGPLQSLFLDPSISEIMVNRFDQIFFEKKGLIQSAGIQFNSEKDYIYLVEKIAKYCQKDFSRFHVDGVLYDGSRINIVIPPMCVKGPLLTIRKFLKNMISVHDLVKSNSISGKTAYFLQACIKARLNIIVSGGTGTGKTTLLNILADFIPPEERVVTIEDTAEIRLKHPNWVRLEAVSRLGLPAITVKDCLANALRMRPDRIIVGECRKQETFEMLQAMNTGHDGSMTTVHSNTVADCLTRLESLILANDIDYPLTALRKQMASAIDLIVQLNRSHTGFRYVSEISEIVGVEQSTITRLDLFTRKSSSPNRNRLLREEFDQPLKSTGQVPTFIKRLEQYKQTFPAEFFNINDDDEGDTI